MRQRTLQLASMVAASAMLVAVSACGDDGPSAQEQYCTAGQGLRSSVENLVSLDVISSGTDGLRASIDAIGEDLDTLRATAGDAAQSEIDALSVAFDEFQSAVSDLGDDLSVANASGVVESAQAVGTAAQAVYGTLTDC
ncbi:MAG: hypothetical protein AAGF73_18220 [Actinomycetota bacterium]